MPSLSGTVTLVPSQANGYASGTATNLSHSITLVPTQSNGVASCTARLITTGVIDLLPVEVVGFASTPRTVVLVPVELTATVTSVEETPPAEFPE